MNLATAGDFLIIDLEATCWEDGNFDERGHRKSEVIELGGVLYRSKEGVLLDFSQIVKPFLNPILSDFCTKLTTITQEMVDSAPYFQEGFNRIKPIVMATEPIFTSWGDYDNNLLRDEFHRYKMRWPFPFHLNLKRLFGKRHARGALLSEVDALAWIGLNFEGQHHRGVDDAKNSARILEWMIRQELEPGKP